MDKESVAVIVRKVKGLVTSRIGGIVLNTSDTIVISMFLGLNALAIYQNYFFIITAVCGLISTFLSGALAGVGNCIVTDTKEKNYRDFKRLTFMFAGIVCICTNCFLVLYQPFMKLWMGADKYAERDTFHFPVTEQLCLNTVYVQKECPERFVQDFCRVAEVLVEAGAADARFLT